MQVIHTGRGGRGVLVIIIWKKKAYSVHQ